TASLTASLRKLEWLKTRADAELAFADKALVAAKTDQAKARAEDLKQKAAPARPDAKPKPDAPAAAKEAAKAAQTRKADAANAASEAKLALEPVSVYISRATQKLYVRRNTHRPAPDGGGEVFDATIEVPVTIRNPDKPIGTHVFTAMARNDAGLRWSVVTVDNGERCQGRARTHHHPAGRARPHRAACIAAIVDHHLGRAAEPRDQLSHRVHRGAEQPAPGRLRDAPAYGRCQRCE